MKLYFRIIFALVFMSLRIGEVHLRVQPAPKEYQILELEVFCYIRFQENGKPFTDCDMIQSTGKPIEEEEVEELNSRIIKLNGKYSLNIELPNFDSDFGETENNIDWPRINSSLPPLGYENFGRLGFYKFYADQVETYDEARAVCEKDGAHLAVLNSRKEALVLKSLYMKYPNVNKYAIIGFRYWDDLGEHLTIFGKTLAASGYAEWDTEEPNNEFGNEYCGAIGRNGKLHDIPCQNYGPWPFICEFEDF